MFSWLQSKRRAASAQPQPARRATPYRPRVEALEDRNLLAHCLLNFTSATFSGEEGRSATISVVRTVFDRPLITVDVNIQAVTATAGTDYTGPNRVTLTWADMELGTKSFTIPLRTDSQAEGNETVRLTLSNPTGGSILANPSTATLTISEPQPRPRLTINDVAVTEGSSGMRTATFTVRLSAASRQTVTVRFVTANRTARAGSDYVALRSTTLTFRPGERSKTIRVQIRGDRVVEANETFFVNLSSAVNATLSDRQGVGTIRNDDRA
jgi:hypothetical protein